MAFIRRDEFVKSVSGPAVAGANVYVCTQPANVTTVPPSPLATIYGDPNGITQLTQPLVTDGFGHTYFYAAAGLYTIVVVANNVVQQSYPDQLLGGALLLETNSALNTNQGILNLIAGTAISLVSDPSGGVTITGGSGITLQTNGVTNTDQSILNLVAGTGISLNSDSSGDVTISSSVPVAPLTRNWCQGVITETATGAGNQFAWATNCQMTGTGITFNPSTNTLPCSASIQSNGTESWYISASSTNGMVVPVDSNPTMIFRAWVSSAAAGAGNDAVAMLMMTDVGIPSNGTNPLVLGNKIGFYCSPGFSTWKAFTTVAGSTTSVDTGVSASALNVSHIFTFVVNFNLGTVVFSIDQVQVASISVLPPSGTTFVRQGAWCTYNNNPPTGNTGVVNVATEYIAFF